MNRLRISFLLSFVLVAIGCSSSVMNIDSGSFIPDSSPGNNNLGILGVHELSINPLDFTAELISVRTPTLGESYLLSGSSFFTTQPCSNCLQMKKIGITPEGYIELGFSLRHPFLPGDPFKPPSGRNRLDLDIFDTAMLIMPKSIVPTNYPLLNASVYDDICPFADGYTRELATLTGDSAACPYFLVVDDYTAGTDTFNEFPMGAEKTFSTYFNLETRLSFDIYLTFGYGASATFGSRLHPFYFNPEFNRKSAWKVKVIPPDPGDTWMPDDSTTEHNVIVKVWDWQHGSTSIANPPVNPDDIAFSSDVSQAVVEIPGMCSAPKIATSPISGSGNDPSDPLFYVIPIANENLLPAGEYQSIVKVVDERIPPSTAVPGLTDTLAHSSDGISLQWLNIPEFATYQIFTATVLSIPCEPMVEIAEGTHSFIHSEYLNIIRNQTDWNTFWSTHNPIGPAPPTIDFDINMAIVVQLGDRGSSGFYVEIDCVKLFPDLIDIVFTEYKPGAG